MSLAIFDLDKTLLNGDSDHAWGEFLAARAIVDQSDYRTKNDQFYEDYKRGCLDIMAYQQFALEPLTRYTMGELKVLHLQFMEEVINKMRQKKADDLINHHRQKGDQLLIITATNSFVTRPIAESLGIAEILATEPEIKNGRYTGRVSGVPCYQDGKVVRLMQWLGERKTLLKGSYFYSDSINDLPLLTEVDHPVVVDPDPGLKQIAEKKHWPIISLRD